METTPYYKSDSVQKIFILSYGAELALEEEFLTLCQTVHNSEFSAFECALNQIKSQFLDLAKNKNMIKNDFDSFKDFSILFQEEYKRLCAVTNLFELHEFMRDNEFTDFHYPNDEYGTCCYSFRIKELIMEEVPKELTATLENETEIFSKLKKWEKGK